MELLAYPQEEPEFGLWAEIPNYSRLVFHPIALPAHEQRYRSPPTVEDEKAAQDDTKTTKSRLHSDCYSADAEFGKRFETVLRLDSEEEYAQDKSYSWPHNSTASGDGLTSKLLKPFQKSKPPKTKVQAKAMVQSNETSCPQPSPEDKELQIFTCSDSFVPTRPDKNIRCPAPSPVTMLKGKRTEEDTPPFLRKRTKSIPTLPTQSVVNSQHLRANKNVHEPAHTSSSPGMKARRVPPPRPEGLPPLNLDVIIRKEPQPIDTVLSPRLLSPRAQKPGSTDPSPCSSYRAPDHSRSLTSIQSPRSAFVVKDVITQTK